jgi:myo-inositol-1(or 4)-monophosphatase
MDQSPGKLLKTAVKAARAGGAILKKGFLAGKSVSYKGFADPVTEYDKGSETAIVSIIQKVFPGHAILAEEDHSIETGSGYRWVIDPLDGTVNFIHSIPFIAVSIGIEHNGQLVAAVIYNPIIDELFTAVRGGGAFLNGQSISVSMEHEIGKSFIVTGFPYGRKNRVEELIKPFPDLISDYQGFRRLGSAAMDLAYVAAGRFDAFYEEGLNPWDTAAGTLLVEEAGGIVTDYRGGSYSIHDTNILASNIKIHETMMQLLHNVIPRPGGK